MDALTLKGTIHSISPPRQIHPDRYVQHIILEVPGHKRNHYYDLERFSAEEEDLATQVQPGDSVTCQAYLNGNKFTGKDNREHCRNELRLKSIDLTN